MATREHSEALQPTSWVSISAQVQDLLDMSVPSQHLVTLTDDEEFAIGASQWSLGDAAVAMIWGELAEAERTARSQAAIARMISDGRMTSTRVAGTKDVVGHLGPALAIVDGMRRHAPTFVVTEVRGSAEEEWRATGIQPLAYLVADEAHGLRAVLVELRGANRHEYRLLTPERAGHGLAEWAFAELAQEWMLSGAEATAAVTITRRGLDGRVGMDRVLLTQDADGPLAQVRRSEGPWALGNVGHQQLADVITAELRRSAELATSPAGQVSA